MASRLSIEIPEEKDGEKMNHTPGPWKAGRGVDDDPTRCFVTQAIPGQPEYVIAEIANGAPSDCLDTEIVNSRLIAAAPDMLEVLRECAEVLDNYSDVDDGDDGRPVANRAMQMLRAIEDVIGKVEDH